MRKRGSVLGILGIQMPSTPDLPSVTAAASRRAHGGSLSIAIGHHPDTAASSAATPPPYLRKGHRKVHTSCSLYLGLYLVSLSRLRLLLTFMFAGLKSHSVDEGHGGHTNHHHPQHSTVVDCTTSGSAAAAARDNATGRQSLSQQQRSSMTPFLPSLNETVAGSAADVHPSLAASAAAASSNSNANGLRSPAGSISSDSGMTPTSAAILAARRPSLSARDQGVTDRLAGAAYLFLSFISCAFTSHSHPTTLIHPPHTHAHPQTKPNQTKPTKK
jgi:hypothetical protein